ncbi:aspartate/glutamate racemase family protein [Candidatus Uhrbacteria bacterium]|nr:aspartate/glutamate racemase family protein [Candidatus Uhrbacteria bacterium]
MQGRNASPFCIGIMGGMGPLAGVELQRRIIERTPATCDQDHFEVLVHTNPRIPDRTQSLRENGGDAYVRALRPTIAFLELHGADVLAMPCCTAHARFDELQASTSVPIIDMVGAAVAEAVRRAGPSPRIGLLTTDGARAVELFPKRAPDPNIAWILPDVDGQRTIMEVIYATKRRSCTDGQALVPVVDALRRAGAAMLLLGCTELSLHASAWERMGYPVVDPLDVLAHQLVTLGMAARSAG